MEERGVSLGILRLGVVVIAHRGVDAEEYAEEISGVLQAVRDAGCVKCGFELIAPFLGADIEALIHLGVGQL